MKQILLPVDFSENAKHAVKYALNLYKNQECNFYFLHVYSPIVYSYDYQLTEGIYELDVHDKVNAKHQKTLNDFINEVSIEYKQQSFNYYGIVKPSVLTDAVCDIVKDKNIEVIIMGTKGVTASNKVLFGTNTIHVINKRVCSVIAVPEKYDIVDVKNILFPTDLYVNYKDRHLKTLKDIARNFNGKIHILHVLFRSLTTQLRNNKDILETQLENFETKFILEENKDIPVAISDYQKEFPSDLLVMINNKHLFFENLFFRPVISNIAMHVELPFLVIPS